MKNDENDENDDSIDKNVINATINFIEPKCKGREVKVN